MKIKFLTIAFLLFTSWKANAQFVSTFNNSYGNGQKDTSVVEGELLKAENDYLSKEAQTLLHENKFPIKDVQVYLAHNYSIQCSDSSRNYKIKIEEVSKILALNKKKYIDSIQNIDYSSLRKAEGIRVLTNAEIKLYFESDNISANDSTNNFEQRAKLYKEGKDFYETINSISGNPRMARKFFPIRSIANAAFFYFGSDGEKKINLVQDVLLQRNFDGSNSINSEVLSGILPFPHVPIKVAIGSTITQVDDKIDSTELAANKLPYGGFFNVSLNYPLFFSSTPVGADKYLVFYLPLENRFNIDEVKDNQMLNKTYYYNELSASFLASIDLLQSSKTADNINFFAGIRTSFFSGGKEFDDKIGTYSFSLLQLNTGIKLAKKFTIGVNLPLSSSSKSILENQSASISLKFEPKK